jgi:hypothetical protein
VAVLTLLEYYLAIKRNEVMIYNMNDLEAWSVKEARHKRITTV